MNKYNHSEIAFRLEPTQPQVETKNVYRTLLPEQDFTFTPNPHIYIVYLHSRIVLCILTSCPNMIAVVHILIVYRGQVSSLIRSRKIVSKCQTF